MPRIEDITASLEKKVDLTDFFGEDTFITIKKMSKYQFSFLLNRNRQGYSHRLFELVREWRESHPNQEMPGTVYDELKLVIPVEEAEERLKMESDADRMYYEYSIKKDGHNFVDRADRPFEIEGGWFYDQFANLTSEGRTLNDFLINEIVMFNHRGIVLGESIDSKSTVSSIA